MQISEVAGLAVEFVRCFQAEFDTERSLFKDQKYNLLKAEPQYSALVLHAAVVLELNPSQLEDVTKELDVDPTWAASLLSLQTLKDASGISAYRKQYQRVMADQTRCITFDMLAECTEGYTILIGLFFKKLGGFTKEDYDFDATWNEALQIVGRYNLEPFKALSLWVNSLTHRDASEFARWLSSSMWNQHPDWLVILRRVNLNNRMKLLAYLIVYEVIPLDIVWGLFETNPVSRFPLFEERWRNEHGGVTKKASALAMAMPLADDDDDDEEEEEEEEYDDMDVDMNELNSSSKSKLDGPNEQSSNPNDMESVEFVRILVGELLGALADFNNRIIEETVIKLISAYPIVFTTSRQVSIGMSKLLSERLDDGIEDLSLLDDLLLPMSHTIYEPAWQKLNDFISRLDTPARVHSFRKYLLPSVDLHPTNQDVLFAFEPKTRHMLYTDLVNRLATENLMVKVRFEDSDKATKALLKRLTKKDAKSSIVPLLLKEFASCAWPSLNVFIQQVESYNIGKLVAQAAASTNDDSSAFPLLAMDMLPLILMQQFTVGRDAVQEDGLHESKWLKLLAQFAGDVAVNHPGFDFIVLIQMCLHQFASNNFSQIFVLDQIVRKLCGIPHQTNLSAQQLLALNTGEPVSEFVQKVISEQPNPQKQRFLDIMQSSNDNHNSWIQLTIASLNYAYSEIYAENSSKILASRLDALTNLLLIFQTLNLENDNSFSSKDISYAAKFAPQFSPRHTGESSVEFSKLRLYDVTIVPELYTTVQSKLNSKDVERALLNHRLRVKSTKQKLGDNFPDLNTIISRIVLSPTDALFTSRYIQLKFRAAQVEPILSRGVVLSILNAATPLETESFAVFFTDIMTFIYTAPEGSEISFEQVKNWNSNFRSAILEAALPGSSYTVLNNVFSLLQRILPVFPALEEDGNAIERRIKLLRTTAKGDLETAVRSLSPQVSKRRNIWCSTEISAQFKDNLVQSNERLLRRFAASVDQQ